MFEPLNKIAFDSEGRIVFIQDAIKGLDYYCPDCGERFAVKNSGKTGPHSKRPHFAHTGASHNCTPESILHKAFKKLSAELLQTCINEKQSFSIEWACPHCAEKYKGDLLAAAKSVVVEKDLQICRPDISLLDNDGSVVATIEVVVSHEPELPTLSYYAEHGIPMIRVDVTEEDLNNVAAKLAKPDFVSLCLNTTCTAVNIKSQKRSLVRHHTKCKNCGQEYFGIEVSCETGLGTFRLMDFNEGEMKILGDIKSKNPEFLWRTAKRHGHEVQILCSPCGCRFTQIPKPRPSNVYYNPFTGKYKKKTRL